MKKRCTRIIKLGAAFDILWYKIIGKTFLNHHSLVDIDLSFVNVTVRTIKKITAVNESRFFVFIINSEKYRRNLYRKTPSVSLILSFIWSSINNSGKCRLTASPIAKESAFVCLALRFGGVVPGKEGEIRNCWNLFQNLLPSNNWI